MRRFRSLHCACITLHGMLVAVMGPQGLLAHAPPVVQRPVSLRDFAPACMSPCAVHLQLQRPSRRMRGQAGRPRLVAAAAAWADSGSDDDVQPGPSLSPSPAHQVQRALGLDYGRRVVGLAVSTLGFAPRPLDGLPGCTVHEQMALAATVLDIARREGCDAIVVGLPVTQRGDLRQRDTDSQQGRRCRNFAENLAAAAAAPSSNSAASGSGGRNSLFKSGGGSGKVRVFLANEQGSTMQARQELAASGRRKAVVSKVGWSVWQRLLAVHVVCVAVRLAAVTSRSELLAAASWSHPPPTSSPVTSPIAGQRQRRCCCHSEGLL